MARFRFGSAVRTRAPESAVSGPPSQAAASSLPPQARRLKPVSGSDRSGPPFPGPPFAGHLLGPLRPGAHPSRAHCCQATTPGPLSPNPSLLRPTTPSPPAAGPAAVIPTTRKPAHAGLDRSRALPCRACRACPLLLPIAATPTAPRATSIRPTAPRFTAAGRSPWFALGHAIRLHRPPAPQQL
jgi:hypothetical protein